MLPLPSKLHFQHLRSHSIRLEHHDVLKSDRHNETNDVSRERLFANVELFAEQNGLMHKLPVLERGALLAQGDTPFEHIPGITAQETQALRNEIEWRWHQPKTLYFTIFVCSIGAVVQGWVQTSANGANLYFPQEFGIGSNSSRDTLLVGLINSGLFLSVGLM